MSDKNTVSINAFLWGKWSAEEGGGVHKLEFTDERRQQENDLKKWLHTNCTEVGNAKTNKMYKITDLEKAYSVIIRAFKTSS